MAHRKTVATTAVANDFKAGSPLAMDLPPPERGELEKNQAIRG
jgi:hypothetical protein